MPVLSTASASATDPSAPAYGSPPDPRTRFYRPELDALRFLAFLLVFAFHSLASVDIDPAVHPWLFHCATAGAFGVPVFFLLSAFLITELLLRELQRTGTIHIQAFYMRRILRIWPLYFAAFVLFALLNPILHGTGTDSPLAWLAFLFFSGNWYILHHGWLAGPIDPLWSISVEEQFYIVIPLIAAFADSRALRLISILLLPVAYLTILLYALHPVPGDNREWANSFVQFQFFSAGTLIALILRGRLIHLAVPLRLAGFLLASLAWLVAVARFDVKSWNPHPTPAGALAGWLLVLLGAILFFVCTLGMPARLIPASLAYLGRISYGLYIFHSFVFFLIFNKVIPRLARYLPALHHLTLPVNALATLFVLALTILLAHLSFLYVETPFLRLKRRFTFVASRD